VTDFFALLGADLLRFESRTSAAIAGDASIDLLTTAIHSSPRYSALMILCSRWLSLLA
jgi:hypothetical protein